MLSSCGRWPPRCHPCVRLTSGATPRHHRRRPAPTRSRDEAASEETSMIRSLIAGLLLALAALPAAAQNPIKIGFGMAETGGLAGNGKAAVFAIETWAADVNAKGGLLGRKIELI